MPMDLSSIFYKLLEIERLGFDFVEMPNGLEAQATIDGVNGTTLGGRVLTVNEAYPREDWGGPRRKPWRPRRYAPRGNSRRGYTQQLHGASHFMYP